MNWKGCGGRWLLPNLIYYPISLEELRKTTKNRVRIVVSRQPSQLRRVIQKVTTIINMYVILGIFRLVIE
jgi:hypothetical protein